MKKMFLILILLTGCTSTVMTARRQEETVSIQEVNLAGSKCEIYLESQRKLNAELVKINNDLKTELFELRRQHQEFIEFIFSFLRNSPDINQELME